MGLPDLPDLDPHARDSNQAVASARD
jgi:hypothetical protein